MYFVISRLILAVKLFVLLVNGDHFRGGTISWTATGNGNEIEFKFRLAWTYGNGPGCTPSLIGQLVTGGSGSWICDKCTPGAISNVNYICTGASQTENWEQGERTFKYTFPGTGPYIVSFTGSAWMKLDYGSPSNWDVRTVVDLRTRSDTGRPNMSPSTASKPIFKLQSDCTHALKIPMIDSDGDDVRCRWSTSAEAASVSRALPNANLDEQTCTINFTASASQSYRPGGWYAVAITLEDYPKKDITVGGVTYTPQSVLSSVPLQFLINTPAMIGSCSDRPIFVNNTPAEGTVIPIRKHETLKLKFYASSKGSAPEACNVPMDVISIQGIVMTSPAGLKSSNVTADDLGRPQVRYTYITWTPTQSQKGSHILCGLADDNLGKTSDPRCVTLLAWDRDPCESTPCENNGTCSRVGFSEDFVCTCVPGFTGVLCETEIDECASQPCQNAGYCLDFINMYECRCDAGFTGINCETDIDECSSQPCQHSSTCNDHVNRFTCTCAAGYTDEMCQTEIDECLSRPCQNGGSCIDFVNSYQCACQVGFTGLICEIDIDECASNPCLQNGTCIDLINGYTCVCPQGWSGDHCQTGLDHCLSFPCLHNGTCQNAWGGFVCDCPEPWHGSVCEYKDINQSPDCVALEYTECDCVMNTNKKHVAPTHHIQAGGYGVLLGIVSSLATYFIWICCKSDINLNQPKQIRVRPATVRPDSSSSNADTTYTAGDTTDKMQPTPSAFRRSTPSMVKNDARMITSTPVPKNLYNIPGTTLNNKNTPYCRENPNELKDVFDDFPTRRF